jgi:uncharacterized repeat protein (TIGR02543 family)
MTMSFKNKFFAVLGTVALSLAGVTVAGTSAQALPTDPQITFAGATIPNGGAQTINFGNYASAISTNTAICLYNAGGNLITPSNSFPSFYNGHLPPAQKSVAAGTIDVLMNRNNSGTPIKYNWVVVSYTGTYSTSSPVDCSYLPSTLAGVVIGAPDTVGQGQSILSASVTSYQVTPALQSPVTQSIVVGQANSTPASVTNSFASKLTGTGPVKWVARTSFYDCDPTLTGNPDLLPQSLTIDETPVTLANDTVPPPPLLVQGTPTSADVGTYHLCVRLGGGNISLFALFDFTVAPVSHTVTFDSQGGSSVANGTFAEGGSLTLPAAPTRSGYTFAGWFTAASGGTALTSPYSPSATSDITLYAQWTVLAHTGFDGQLAAESGLVALLALGLGAIALAVRRRSLRK